MDNNFLKNVSNFIETVEYEISLLSNISSYLYETINDINWIGFYLYKDSSLILGPFAGHPACLKIKMGEGVCGQSLKDRITLNIPDVNKITNYISCSSETQSELVVPIIIDNKPYGVLDIDSKVINRFDEQLEKTMEEVVKIIIDKLLNINFR